MDKAQQDGGDHAAPGGTGEVARGAWYGLCAQAVDKVLPIVILLYLARTLAAEQFGVYGFIVAYLSFFQIVCDYSVDTVLVREMSAGLARREAILRAGLGLKLVLALSLALLATLAVGPVSGGQVSPGLMLAASLTLPTALGGAFRAYFRAEMDIRSVFLIALARAFLLALGVIVAVLAGAGLGGIFAAMATANLLTALAVAAFLTRRLQPTPSFDADDWMRLLRGVMPLFATALAITVSLRAGHLLLMNLRGPVEVGLLSAASRVSEAFTLLPEALMISVLPLMAARHGDDVAGALRAATRSARYLVAITGVPVVICAVEGSAVMTLLFGESFSSAGPTLAILALGALFAASGTVILNLLVAADRVRTLYRNTAVFAAVNVVAAFLLIPSYGEMGAAVAVLVGSAFSQVSLALLPSTRDYVRPLLAPALLAVVAVPAAAAAGSYSGLGAAGSIVVSLVIYSALACAGVAAAGYPPLARSARPGTRSEG